MKTGSRFYLLASRVIILIIVLAASTYKLVPIVSAQETPTPTLTKEKIGESAVSKFSEGLLAKEVMPPADLQSNPVLAILGQIFNLVNFTRFFEQSKILHQAYLPEEVKPEEDNGTDPLKTLRGFLEGSTGFYGATLPKEVQSENIKGSEGAFEKAYFPEGINPITGK